jgi:hypothetical protein
MYGLYLDNVREQVHRLPTRCVSSKKKKFTIVLGLKSRVVTVGIRALGLDPENH